MNNYSHYYHTIKYLIFKQIFFRIYYTIRKHIFVLLNIKFPLVFPGKAGNVKLQASISASELYIGDGVFCFLNIAKDFSIGIDWNYLEYGRLWTYNLNYFDYLLQSSFNKEEGLFLVYDFIDRQYGIKIGYEPYPISLRTINWIKFCTLYKIQDKKIDASLYAQFMILTNNIEYHIMGNHLLENGFAMLFGAYYFRDEKFYRKARKILKKEIKEQILEDGAHFELSPMYHQIMLYRLLDCYNLMINNNWKSDDDLFAVIKEKVCIMLGWLQNISFQSGDIPLLNDSSNGIAPLSKDIYTYAKNLKLINKIVPLNGSGYRKFVTPFYEVIYDTGEIGPNYQPGHAHADTFSFVMNIHNRPIIIDTGCSTYEWGKVRNFERGTLAHNTVVVNNRSSSQIWGSHRVANRANVKILKIDENMMTCSHDGYKSLGVTHIRSFLKESPSIFTINDKIINNCTNTVNEAIFHFSPCEHIRVNNDAIIGQDYDIVFSGAKSIVHDISEIALEFNKRVQSSLIKVTFCSELITTIYINENIIHNR